MHTNVIWGLMIGSAVGCVAGNFLYQAFGEGDWLRAAEISFFQVWALAAVAGGIGIYVMQSA
jgi:hypothetical protein